MLLQVNISLQHIVILALLLRSSLSLSSSSREQQPRRSTAFSSSPKSKYPFLSFEFDKSTGICRNPASFQYLPNNQVDDDSVMEVTELNNKTEKLQYLQDAEIVEPATFRPTNVEDMAKEIQKDTIWPKTMQIPEDLLVVAPWLTTTIIQHQN